MKETVDEANNEGLEIDYLVSDFTKEEDCKSTVNYTVNKYGRIDILFNNAGVSQGGEILINKQFSLTGGWHSEYGAGE